MTKQTECRNGCGRILEWDNNQPGKYKFVEAATGQLHRCPNYNPGAKFEQNKQQAGYRGPEQNQVQTDVANLVGDVAVLKEQVKELQFTLSGLGEAIAKISVKPASEV